MDLNSHKMRFWPKFGNPGLNRWWLVVRTNPQAQNWVNFDFQAKIYFEGQGQSPSKTAGSLTKVFYIYGPNLVILAWKGDELSRGHTWWPTDGRTQATTIPRGQNWPQVKP